MAMSGIQRSDVGMATKSIPQKSDGFHVRNSFVQLWENKEKLEEVKKFIQVFYPSQLSRFLPVVTRRDL